MGTADRDGSRRLHRRGCSRQGRIEAILELASGACQRPGNNHRGVDTPRSPGCFEGQAMNFLSAIRVALDALLVHKGRSSLTSLGIVIGISAVIAMVSAGEGARLLLEDRLSSLGTNLILVRAGTRSQQGMVADFAPLTGADARAIRDRLGHELTAVAETQMAQRLVSTPTAHHGTSIVGVTHELLLVRGWKMQNGRFISSADVKKMA